MPAARSASPSSSRSPSTVADLAASFQEAVVDCLVGKAFAALKRTGKRILCVGGGVAANRRLRGRLQEEADRQQIRTAHRPAATCTDNAVMGAIAVERLKAGLVEALDLDVFPGVVRGGGPLRRTFLSVVATLAWQAVFLSGKHAHDERGHGIKPDSTRPSFLGACQPPRYRYHRRWRIKQCGAHRWVSASSRWATSPATPVPPPRATTLDPCE